MIINHKYKFMFFAEPHTASRACARMLQKIPGSESLAHHHATQEYLLEREMIPKSDYLRFSVIRDPRDIIATKIAHAQYNYKMVAVVSDPIPTLTELIERYVKWGCARECFFYHDPDYKINYSWLDYQLSKLLHGLGIETVPKLEKFGVTPEKKNWEYYFNNEQNARMRENIPEIEQFLELL